MTQVQFIIYCYLYLKIWYRSRELPNCIKNFTCRIYSHLWTIFYWIRYILNFKTSTFIDPRIDEFFSFEKSNWTDSSYMRKITRRWSDRIKGSIRQNSSSPRLRLYINRITLIAKNEGKRRDSITKPSRSLFFPFHPRRWRGSAR